MVHRDAAWTAAGLVVILLGMVLMVLNIVWQVRTGLWRRDYQPPEWKYSRERRRDLRSQVMTLKPRSDADLPELRATAQRMVAGRRGLLLPVALIVIQTGGVLTDPARWHWLFVGALTLFLAGCMLIVARRANQGARFLERFPETRSADNWPAH